MASKRKAGTGKNGRASLRRARALALFLGGVRTHAEIAELLGVSVSSVDAWATEPDWKARVAETEGEVIRRAVTWASQNADLPGRVYAEIASDPDAEPRDRIAAADKLARIVPGLLAAEKLEVSPLSGLSEEALLAKAKGLVAQLGGGASQACAVCGSLGICEHERTA